MEVWDAIHYIRFEGFLHVPEDEKQRLCRSLLDVNFCDPRIPPILLQIFQSHQQIALQRFLSHLRHTKQSQRRFPGKDLELLLELYWDEGDPEISKRLLKALVEITHRPDTHTIWRIAVNMLLNRTNENRDAAILLLESFA
jgi:hypothetical protein